MSQYWQVLQAVKAVLSTRPEVQAAGASVVIRKRPYFDRDRDTLPLITLSPAAELVDGLQQSNGAQIGYPVLVAIFLSGKIAPADEAAIQLLLSLREAARRALFVVVLPGADSVFDCRYEPAPPFDSSAFDKGLDVSFQRFTFINDEARAG